MLTRTQQQFNKIGSYSILSIPIKSWILILFVLACVTGGLFRSAKINSNPVSGTFTAEIVDVWARHYVDETGGSTVYYVRLRRDQEELTCRVSPVLIRLWRQLTVGERYTFSVTRTNARCYINKAVEVKVSPPLK